MHRKKKLPDQQSGFQPHPKSGDQTSADPEESFASLFGRNAPAVETENFCSLFEDSCTENDLQKAATSKSHTPSLPQDQSITNKVKSYPPPQLEIDLHGFTAKEAETKTESFIRTALKSGLMTVRIITGKGLHSEGRAVLPDIVEYTLLEFKNRGDILAYRWEKGKKHSSGSVVVYLRRRSQS